MLEARRARSWKKVEEVGHLMDIFGMAAHNKSEETDKICIVVKQDWRDCKRS